MTTIDITLNDPFVFNATELIRNPYPFYEQIRQQGNLVWSSAGEERWITVGYNATLTCLTDSRFGVEPSEEYMANSNIRHAPQHKDLVTGLTKFLLDQRSPAAHESS